MKPYFYFCFIIIFFIVKVNLIFASVVINELMPNPSSSKEWIELFNNGDQVASLSGVKLMDQLSSPSIIFTFDQQEILPLDFLVIELNVAKLNNSADGVILTDQNNLVIDSTSYVNAPLDKSWARSPNGIGEFIYVESTSGLLNLSLTPTPIPTLIPSPTPTPVSMSTLTPTPMVTSGPTVTPAPIFHDLSVLQLSEFVACAQTDNVEWLEFYNKSDSDLVNLTLKLENQSNSKKTLSNLNIAGENYQAFDIGNSFLTNSGGTFQIKDVNNNLLLEIKYPVCTKGKSFIFYDGSWIETEFITKNKANTLLNSGNSINSAITVQDNVLATPDSGENTINNNLNSREQTQQQKIDYQTPLLNLSKNFITFPLKDEVLASDAGNLIEQPIYKEEKNFFNVIIIGLLFISISCLGFYVFFFRNQESKEIF